MQWIGPLLAVAALASLVLLGVVGLGRGEARALADFDLYYAAGKSWLAGSSMYDAAAFGREAQALGWDAHGGGFAYSPAFAPFAVALAALPYRAACFAMWAFNLAGVALLWFAALRLARHAGAASRPQTPWVLVCIVAGLPCAANVLWIGQLTVWMAALTCASWCALRERRTLLAGVLLGLTSIKPQFSLFLVLWLALEREWKVLLAAASTALVLCSYAMVVLGPLAPFAQFLGGVAHYADADRGADALGNVHVLGLPSLLAALGVEAVRVGPFIGAGCAGVLVLWFARRRLHEEALLALLFAAQLAFVYGHDLELVFLVPAWVWLWMRHGASSRTALAGFALMVVVSLPKRLVTAQSEGLLVHWRDLALLLLFALLLSSARVRAASARPASIA